MLLAYPCEDCRELWWPCPGAVLCASTPTMDAFAVRATPAGCVGGGGLVWNVLQMVPCLLTFLFEKSDALL
jgi:hypothetical protein